MPMKPRPFAAGQPVTVKAEVSKYGGKPGRVEREGVHLGYRAVWVKLADVAKPLVFAPKELERR